VARTIVVGYDGSAGSGLALEKAIELAKLEAAKIVVVFAYEIPAAYGGETGDYRRAVRERAEEATASVGPCPNVRLPVSSTSRGRPARA
jgi:nucleotide-binding universal stress UspA family protein